MQCWQISHWHLTTQSRGPPWKHGIQVNHHPARRSLILVVRFMKILRVALLVFLSGCASPSNYRHSGDFFFFEYSPSKWHIQYNANKMTQQEEGERSLAKKALQLCPHGYSPLPEFDYIEVTSSTPSEVRARSKPTNIKSFSIWVRCNQT
jgi:hypothetical protein